MSEIKTVKCTQSVRKTCKYRANIGGNYCCYYAVIMKQSRGCSFELCDKYVRSKKEIEV
jgi:hypothetical protein